MNTHIQHEFTKVSNPPCTTVANMRLSSHETSRFTCGPRSIFLMWRSVFVENYPKDLILHLSGIGSYRHRSVAFVMQIRGTTSADITLLYCVLYCHHHPVTIIPRKHQLRVGPVFSFSCLSSTPRGDGINYPRALAVRKHDSKKNKSFFVLPGRYCTAIRSSGYFKSGYLNEISIAPAAIMLTNTVIYLYHIISYCYQTSIYYR